MLSLRLARSSPSAHSVAILSKVATVFGFSRPRNSWKSLRDTPCTKASITISSDVVLTEFHISVHRLMYARNVSSGFCTQDRSSSNVFGLTASGSKFLIKSLLKSSHESYEDGGRALSQSRVVPSSMTCMYCMAVVFVPRWHDMANL